MLDYVHWEAENAWFASGKTCVQEFDRLVDELVDVRVRNRGVSDACHHLCHPGPSQLHVSKDRFIASASKGFIGEGESGKRRRNNRVDTTLV
jgi:hypothetical protein